MTESAVWRQQRQRWKRAAAGAAAVLVAAALYLGVTALLIHRQSLRDETRAADAIVVFGAAEYAGRPSPVFRARLDHALSLYQRGLAPIIITTGASRDPRFSEGRVGHDYLRQQGIAERHLIAETQSGNTAKSAERVGAILRANGMKTCIAVSDGYHIFRIKRVLGREGVEVFGAPRPEAHPLSGSERLRLLLREAVGYTAWLLYLN